MINDTYHLEFITPCFCAGADSATAELRAPSIRGQLHWWFRALGGAREMENEVFGSVLGDNIIASAVQVRTSITERAPDWNPPKKNQQSPAYYIYHFAHESGKKKNAPCGPRWNQNGNIAPRTKFTIQIRQTRRIKNTGALEKFSLALEMFLRLGALGLRSTRGLGAFHCDEFPFTLDQIDPLKQRLEKHGFGLEPVKFNMRSWDATIELAGEILKYTLRKEYSAGKAGNNQTPLGSSGPRQTSAVRLRPVRLDTNDYGLVIFEAPAGRVLGKPSQKGAPVLSNPQVLTELKQHQDMR